jgi:serum/glucocorticoid-regulated kinase 2
MRCIHSKGIIQGDLKPVNIRLNGSGEDLMADFGLSRFQFAEYILAYSGTVDYVAPGLFDEQAICTRKVDVCAFGLVLYEILIRIAVFASSHYTFPIIRRILIGRLPTRRFRPSAEQ